MIMNIGKRGGGSVQPSKPSIALNSHQISEYLYEVSYTDIDDRYAFKYFETKTPVLLGPSCSSFIYMGKLTRYLDWTYDNNVEFIVRTPAKSGKHAVTGIASALPLTKSFVESGNGSDLYRILPYYLVDGKNDSGLAMSVNVVPNDYGTTDTRLTVIREENVCLSMLVRYLLDRCANIDEVIDVVTNKIGVYAPKSLEEMSYEMHFLIAEKGRTVCLEFINNEPKFIDITARPIMTNFHLWNSYDNIANGVYTPADVSEGRYPSSQGITPHGAGLERYNKILYVISNGIVLRDPSPLFYTNTYKLSTYPFWYSEFVGGDLTVDSNISEFSDTVDRAIEAYNTRSRDIPKTWQTVHVVEYPVQTLDESDNDNLMTVIPQEQLGDSYQTDIIISNSEFPEPSMYIEVGEIGRPYPSESLAVGGLFFKPLNDVIHK